MSSNVAGMPARLGPLSGGNVSFASLGESSSGGGSVQSMRQNSQISLFFSDLDSFYFFFFSAVARGFQNYDEY